MNGEVTEPQFLEIIVKNVWFVAGVLVVAWAFVAHRLWISGNLAGNYINAFLLGAGIIATVLVAVIYPTHQSLLLLGVPVFMFYWNKSIEKGRKNKDKIIFIFKKELEYGKTLLKELTRQAESENILIESQEIDSDASQSLRVNSAISQSPQSVVVVPTSSDGDTVKDVAKLYQKNIPVVVVDREINQKLYTNNSISSPSHIMSDFRVGGEMAAEAMEFALVGSGNIAVIAGPKESVPSESRLSGFALKIISHAPKMKIVYCGHCISWEREEGKNMMLRCGQELADNGIELSGVFCCNDTLALGAIEALDILYQRKIFKPNSVHVVGFDGLDEMKAMIREGKASATIDVQIQEQAAAILREITNALGKPGIHVRKDQDPIITKPEVIRVGQGVGDSGLIKTKTPNRAEVDKSKFDAVFFDMDGLMIDNEAAQMKSFNEVLNPYGISISKDEFSHLVGVSQKDIFSKYAEGNTDLPSIDELMDRKREVYFPILQKSFKAATGLLELTRYLKSMDVKVGVVSSSPRSDIETILSDLGLTEMDFVYSSLDSRRPKPYPDAYIEAANELGIDRKRCLVLEDSSVGIQSAIAAGMTCVAIPNSFTINQDLAGANHQFENLRKVRDWLHQHKMLKELVSVSY